MVTPESTNPSAKSAGGADADVARRDRVLDAVLPHVAFDGWGQAGVASAVREGAITRDEALVAFPGGAIDMVAYHSRRADRRMVEELDAAGLAAMKMRERIATAVRTRLARNAEHREAVRRALTLLALPHNAPLAARLLYRTVDAMWYAAGDTAVDFSFYTKRATLAGVYTTTLLHWLDDRSPDGEATWAFLDRRVEDVMRFERLKARARDYGARWRTRPAR